MVFSSLLFLTLFLPLTMILYYLLPGRYKNILLLIVSLIFYAWGEPKHIILMLITTVYTWLLSLLVMLLIYPLIRKIQKIGGELWRE